MAAPSPTCCTRSTGAVRPIRTCWRQGRTRSVAADHQRPADTIFDIARPLGKTGTARALVRTGAGAGTHECASGPGLAERSGDVEDGVGRALMIRSHTPCPALAPARPDRADRTR